MKEGDIMEITYSRKGGYPGVIDNCAVIVKMNVPGATHVGGLIGTGLYYYGEETAFKISNCTVNDEIIGAVTPGAVAGRAENSVISFNAFCGCG